ncbi:phage tail protein [Terribacillus saccharophilus]|uniref:Phage-related protein n=1 Tax=Terribacillus saccharophilus TaxID=361277 RepID=A0ABX4H0T0_9BACI|nr:hypothetical protein [Terribacillus saccharophilus]PAD36322.1 hypothetical protein CHH56_04835 [Terribacillus saccharophilus]PAD95036.1 hypothetical protein CHH50_15650 [Terribacillus saccharophilus]PAE00741.1 hypothetical protein CHH48_05540 [Terribacillus saccharophilus]
MHESFMARIGARIKEFQAKMKQVDAAVKRTAMGTDKQIGADTAEFHRKAAQVSAKARDLERKSVIVRIEARIDNFQNVMGRIANSINAFGTVAGNTFRGLGIMLSSTLVPIIASLIGLIGNLGVVAGTVAGSAFSLASAFGAAGTAALAFGLFAAPTIQAVFGDIEDMNAAQYKAAGAFQSMKSNYMDLAKAIEQPVLEAFTKAMDITKKLIGTLTPMVKSAAGAVNNLMDSLAKSIDSKAMREFFDYLNKSAGPMLETIGKSVGNFIKGFLSMMTAFGPLAEDTAKGFLRMSEGFASWAAGLSQSAKFQAFVNYIRENMPKIKSIVGDAITGIINTFSGFSGTASGMLDKLQGMMSSFKKWSSEIGSNVGFQKFLGYIVESGPKVASLIGNIVKFIVNLGVAMAPLGSKLLDMVNSFISWTNSMMETHPVIGKIIAASTVIVGALVALVPVIAAIRTAFSGFGRILLNVVTGAFSLAGSAFSKIGGFITKLLPKILSLGTKALPWLARGFALLTGPVGLVISILSILIPIFVKLWKENETFRNKVKEVWAGVKNVISSVTTAVAAFIVNTWGSIKSWWEENQETIKSAAKKVWDAVITNIVSVLTNVYNFIVTIWTAVSTWWTENQELIKSTAQKVWDFISTNIISNLQTAWTVIQTVIGILVPFFSAAWDVIKNVITTVWNVIKTTISTVINLVWSIIKVVMLAIQGDWSGVWEEIKNILQIVWDWIKSIVQIGIDFVKGLISTGWELIKTVTSNVWTWIKDKISEVWENIKSSVQTKIEQLKANLLAKWLEIKVKSALLVQQMKEKVVEFFQNIVSKVKEKMDQVKQWVQNKWEEAKSTATTKLQNLVSTVREKFGEVVDKVREKMQEAVDKVAEFVGDMPGKVRDGVTDMISAGEDLINGVIDGIKGKIDAGLEAVSGFGTSLVEKFKSVTGIASPSKVFKAASKWIPVGAAVGINKNASTAVNAVSNMASAMTGAFKPDLATNSQFHASLDTSLTRGDFGKVQHDFGTQIDDMELPEPTIIVQGNVDREGITWMVNDRNARETRLRQGFMRK